MRSSATCLEHISKSGVSSSKLIAMLLLISLFELGVCNHLQRHSQTSPDKQYDSTLYFNELNGIQTKLTTDLNNIKDQFTRINLQLSNTNISSSAQVIFLQQSLADERDALFNIQNYLNVPFALRSCQCVNLTQPQKDSLQIQIQNVSQAISNLSGSVTVDSNGNQYQNPVCQGENCAAVQSINSQIAQMKNYVAVINDTITSQCCKVVNYIYRDDLVDSTSWIYGNLTDEQYRLSVFQRSQNVNLTQCPKTKPYVNLTTNQCFACANGLLFNLETRACQPSCQSTGLIFNNQTHNCDYNRTCPANQHFSQATHQCVINLGTASNCPTDRPIWNQAILSCQKCLPSVPYFDPVVQACRACTENQNLDLIASVCVSKVASPPQDISLPTPSTPSTWAPSTFVSSVVPQNPSTLNQNNPNINTNASPTQNPSNVPGPILPPRPSSVNSGTFSNCPPDSPFWNSQIFACSKCPQTTPFFNTKTTACQKCPANTAWDPTSNTCVSTNSTASANNNCLSNQIYNVATGKCDSISPTGQIGLCPPSTPFWNSNTLTCNKCNLTNPLWNDKLQQCTPCPADTAWDVNYNLCQSTLVQCPSGQVLNKTTGNCSVLTCPTDKPIYNSNTSQCQSCPEGTVLNNLTLICQSTSSQKRSISVCPTSKPYWNALRLACQACPDGQQWSASLNQCSTFNSHQSSEGLQFFVHQTFLMNSRFAHKASAAHTSFLGLKGRLDV